MRNECSITHRLVIRSLSERCSPGLRDREVLAEISEPPEVPHRGTNSPIG